MNHLWQRFLLASSLLVGLAVGVAATVFGYSNLATVDIHWSVLHLNGVPLWTVAVVPITLLLVAGTLYHWIDGLHHFTEHMRHRHRVHELEQEVSRLRAHLDQVLEMPRADGLPAKAALPAGVLSDADLAMSGLGSDEPPPQAGEPEAEPEPVAAPEVTAESKDGGRKPTGERRKRAHLVTDENPETAPAAVHTNGVESEPAITAQEA